MKGHKHTKESRKKMGLARKGKKYPKSSQAKLGHKVSEETKKKISLTLKKSGFKPPDATGRILSAEHKRKLSGKNSPRWKDGITSTIDLIRHSIRYKQWRQSVYIRDDFTCQECRDNKSRNLEAHHIRPFNELVQEAREYMPLLPLYDALMIYTPLWDIDNAVTLCQRCHNKTRKGY